MSVAHMAVNVLPVFFLVDDGNDEHNNKSKESNENNEDCNNAENFCSQDDTDLIPRWYKDLLLAPHNHVNVVYNYRRIIICFALTALFGAAFPLVPAIMMVMGMIILREQVRESDHSQSTGLFRLF